MGKGKVERPEKLATKLRLIRLKLGLSQAEMADTLEKHGVKMHHGYVGSFEIDDRVPSLPVILAYAKLARISTDVIIDDERDLPKGF